MRRCDCGVYDDGKVAGSYGVGMAVAVAVALEKRMTEARTIEDVLDLQGWVRWRSAAGDRWLAGVICWNHPKPKTPESIVTSATASSIVLLLQDI